MDICVRIRNFTQKLYVFFREQHKEFKFSKHSVNVKLSCDKDQNAINTQQLVFKIGDISSQVSWKGCSMNKSQKMKKIGPFSKKKSYSGFLVRDSFHFGREMLGHKLGFCNNNHYL